MAKGQETTQGAELEGRGLRLPGEGGKLVNILAEETQPCPAQTRMGWANLTRRFPWEWEVCDPDHLAVVQGRLQTKHRDLTGLEADAPGPESLGILTGLGCSGTRQIQTHMLHGEARCQPQKNVCKSSQSRKSQLNIKSRGKTQGAEVRPGQTSVTGKSDLTTKYVSTPGVKKQTGSSKEPATIGDCHSAAAQPWTLEAIPVPQSFPGRRGTEAARPSTLRAQAHSGIAVEMPAQTGTSVMQADQPKSNPVMYLPIFCRNPSAGEL